MASEGEPGEVGVSGGTTSPSRSLRDRAPPSPPQVAERDYPIQRQIFSSRS